MSKASNFDFECRYTIAMLAILLLNITLCSFTLCLFRNSADVLIENIFFLISSINVVINASDNKLLNIMFYVLNAAQVLIIYIQPTTSDFKLNLQKVIFGVSLFIINICKKEYKHYNKVLNEQEKITESVLGGLANEKVVVQPTAIV